MRRLRSPLVPTLILLTGSTTPALAIDPPYYQGTLSMLEVWPNGNVASYALVQYLYPQN